MAPIPHDPNGRKEPMRVRTATVLLILAFVPALLRAAPPTDWKTPTKDWAKGPVGLIMTPDEEKEFRALKTDDERAAFAKTFWEKRDPTPGTPENEYETIFWKRVEQADKNYKDQIRDGSATDYGRVFILFGPPTGQHKDPRYSYWDYEPTPMNGIKEKISLSFASIETGTKLLDKKKVDEYLAAHPEARGIGWQLPQAPAAAADETAQAAPAKEHVEDTSPESQRQIPILDAVAAKGSGPTDVPFQVHNDTYAAADGTTLVVTTIEVPRDAAHGSGSEAILSFARLAPDAAGGKPYNLTGVLPFVPAPAADGPAASFVYQARTNLKPGAYHMTVVVEDKVVKGQMGTLVQPLAVPDYSAKTFDMSSVSLLAQYGRKDDAAGPDDEKKGSGLFSMGSFRLVPRALPVLSKSDALAFYYQIYNPSPDPATSKPNLESTYTFYIKDASGWKPFRRPVVKPVGQVEIWDVAMKDLLAPDQVLPVDFRMEAKVTDKTSGKSLTREIVFSVR
jgi:GWxTD domain-containing protein